MPRFWRRLRRIRRSNLVVTGVLVAVVVLMQVLNFESDAEVFEAPQSVARFQDTPIVIAAGAPILLGYAGPLSGPLADQTPNIAITGVLRWKELNGDLIQGHAVDLVGEEDGGTVDDVAVVAANLLIERPGLVGIVGPTFSAAANVTIEIYAAAGIVLWRAETLTCPQELIHAECEDSEDRELADTASASPSVISSPSNRSAILPPPWTRPPSRTPASNRE